jgi:uncharacterized membrane protein
MKKPHRPATIGNRLAPPRFILFVALFALASGLGAIWLRDARAVLIGFDIAAFCFLLSCIPAFRKGSAADMRRHALENDAARLTLLVITGLVTLTLLILVAVELGQADNVANKALILTSLVLAWLFSNTVYAFHYAHLCYSEGGARDCGSGGLHFPETPDPNYWDFLYFAFTLGMTFQTSDVEIADRSLRRVATFHCFAAFVFNLGLVAFTISVLGI